MALTISRDSQTKDASHKKKMVHLTVDEQKRVNLQTDEVELGFPPAVVKLYGRVSEDQSVRTEQQVKNPQIIKSHVNFPKSRIVLEAFEEDLPYLRFGQSLIATSRGVPEARFRGRLRSVSERINSNTNTAQVVADVVDQGFLLKPGMFVTVQIKVGLANKGRIAYPELADYWLSPKDPFIRSHNPGICPRSGETLVKAEALGYVTELTTADAVVFVPETAPLIMGRESVLFVLREDGSHFEARSVQLGPKGDGIYVVSAGAKPGEVVVSNGAFVLDADLQLSGNKSFLNYQYKPTPQPQKTNQSSNYN